MGQRRTHRRAYPLYGPHLATLSHTILALAVMLSQLPEAMSCVRRGRSQHFGAQGHAVRWANQAKGGGQPRGRPHLEGVRAEPQGAPPG